MPGHLDTRGRCSHRCPPRTPSRQARSRVDIFRMARFRVSPDARPSTLFHNAEMIDTSITSACDARELCTRVNDGIQLTLYWLPTEDRLRIEVIDTKLGERFGLDVPAADAMHAFHHPYVYAAGLRILTTHSADDRQAPEAVCSR